MPMRHVPLAGPHAGLLAGLLAICAPALHAQALPGSIDPGQLGRELRQPPAPRAQPELPRTAPTAPRAVAPTGAAFRVDAVQFRGNTVFDADTLRADAAELIGHDVHLADVERAAERMTIRYRAAGYVLSQVIVPEQALTGGSVVFQVYEGYVDGAVYQGDHVPDVLRDYVAKIIASRPLTNRVLERYLLLINDIPGITAHAALAPSPTQAGAAELTLIVSTQRAGGDVGLDNRLTRSLGDARVIAGAQLSNALLAQEQFSARAIEGDTNRVSIGSLGWEQAWGSESLRTSAVFGAVHTRPRLSLPQTSSSRSLDLGASWAALRSRDRNVYLRATWSGLNSSATITSGDTRLFDDHVRALRIGLSADLADEFGGVDLLDVEASQGLGHGDEALPSRAGANPHFHKFTLFASRLQPFTPRWSLLAAVQAQASGTPLYSSEQFAAGGDVFLRAFDPAELIADRGWAGKIELRFALADDTLLYAYFDHADVTNATSAQAVQGNPTAGSTGIGVRAGWNAFSAYLECGQPLQRDVAAAGNRDTRFFGGLRYVF